MDKKIVKAAAWMFVKNNNPQKALSAIMYLELNQGRNEFLDSALDYYLQQASSLIRPILFNGGLEPDLADIWADVMDNFKSAKAVALSHCTGQWLNERKIINKALEHIKNLGAPVNDLVEFLHPLLCDGLLAKQEKNYDIFLKKVIKTYLEVQNLEGRDIFKVSELMSEDAAEREARRLLIIFIKWGDYEAIRAIGNKYAKLEEDIYFHGEDILLSCLQRGRLEDAIQALSLIGNSSKRFEYADLLGADLIDQK